MRKSEFEELEKLQREISAAIPELYLNPEGGFCRPAKLKDGMKPVSNSEALQELQAVIEANDMLGLYLEVVKPE